jgi:hypothetical protein
MHLQRRASFWSALTDSHGFSRSPYITTAIRRFGNWVLNLTPPADTADGHLALAPSAD